MVRDIALVRLLCDLWLAICDAMDMPPSLRRVVESHLSALKEEAAKILAVRDAKPIPVAQPGPARVTRPDRAPRRRRASCPGIAALAPTPNAARHRHPSPFAPPRSPEIVKTAASYIRVHFVTFSK